MIADLQTLNLPDTSALKKSLEIFVSDVLRTSEGNIKSIMLYGGLAKGDYIEGKSNTNILMVFDSIDLPVLDSLCVIFQKAIGDFRFSPFLLTLSEIKPAKNVFAVKLFDIKQHHVLLYGEDFTKDLNFDKKTLAFISQQELRNQISRMKYFYIRNFNVPELLHEKTLQSFTTFLINANTYLYLSTGKYYSSRTEIAAVLKQYPNIDQKILQELIQLKNGVPPGQSTSIKTLYGELMLQYKYLIKDLQKLEE
jgi:hypothetical protein